MSKRKRRPRNSLGFFDGKKCYICKKKAEMMRFYNDKSYLLCENSKCQMNWLFRMGLDLKININ